MKLGFAVFALMAAALLAVANERESARAAGFYFVDANVLGGNQSGDSWANANPDLQDAIASDATEIWVADGTYQTTTTASRSFSFELETGVTILGGFAGGEASADERDPSAHQATLSGLTGGIDPALTVVLVGASVTGTVLDGFTIEGGKIESDLAAAGIVVAGSSTMRNVTISGNTSTANSAGGAIVEFGADAIFENAVFAGNIVGAPVGIGGGLLSNGSVELTNVTFQGNTASGFVLSAGGGLYVGGGTAALNNVTFSGNSGGNSDALAVVGGTVTVDNSVVYGDDTGTTEIQRTGGTLTINDSIVQGGCPAGATCDHVIPSDPELGSLQDNGGAVDTMAIAAASPAADVGNDTTCAATDARGVSRARDGNLDGTAACDMGAFELKPPTASFAGSTASGPESAPPALTVTLDPVPVAEVSVTYSVTGGTATGGGTDYTLPAGTLTFGAGDGEEGLPLTLDNDTLDEPNETVVVTLSPGTGATVESPSTLTFTITDDDAAPAVSFSAGTGGGPESAALGQAQVTLSTASGRSVSVAFAVTGGSASAPADFSLGTSSPITFAPGETSKNIKLAVKDNFLVEPAETVVLGLSAPVNAMPGAITTFTYTIANNDSGTCKGKAATMVGTSAADTIIGTAGNDVIVAGAGNDTVKAGGGNDVVCGGKGNDTLLGAPGNDTLLGETGNDTLNGGGGNDNLDGAAGKDKLKGGGGADTLDGGGGTDTVNGGLGNDTVKSGGGNNDAVKGQGGKDRLAGGLGTGDRCDGGLNKDALLTGHGCEVTVSIP